MWLLIMTACGPRIPPGVPDGAVRLAVADGSVALDGEPVHPWSALSNDPTRDTHEPLVEALRGLADRPLWLDLPGESSWFEVRKVANSAAAAGVAPLVVSVAGTVDVLPLADAPLFGLGGVCADGPLTVHGAAPLVTLSVQTGADGAWIVGTGRFLPVVDRRGTRGPVDGLPRECLAVPACEVLYPSDAELRAACEGGGDAQERVRLGGPNGCLLPIAREPGDVARWTAELPSLITGLGLAEQELLMLMPEARTRLDALVAVLKGFEASERAVPAVGATLLIEGNDGPPVCNASVRDARALATSQARWLGALRGH